MSGLVWLLVVLHTLGIPIFVEGTMRGRRDFFGLLLAIIAAVVGLIVGPIIINLVTGGKASAKVWAAFVVLVMSIIALAAWQFLRQQRRSIEADAGGKSWPPHYRTEAIEAIQAYQSKRLNQSLSRLDRVRLHLEADSAAVDPPQDVSIRRPLGAAPTWSRGVSIEKAFSELGKSLVILGMPGSGKTTMLLVLARSLLDSARRDARHPLPVVVELTTWGRLKRTRTRGRLKRTLLRRKVESSYKDPTDWLLDQLDKTYGIGRKVAQSWLADRQLTLLFDGLDEMPQADRERCVSWLNSMQDTWRVPSMVVCCRTNEYERLPKLHLQGAVAIQPLTRKLITKWLDGSQLAGLRTALAADETLWELLDAPLWFDVMTLVFEEGSNTKSLTGKSAEERRTELLDAYITMGLQRRKMPSRYTDDETFRWLSQLAGMIRESDKAAIRRRRLGWDLYGLQLPHAGEAAVANRLLPSTLTCLAAGFVFSIALRLGLVLGIIAAVVCIIGVLIATSSSLVPAPPPPPSAPLQRFRMAAPLGAVIGLLVGGLGVVLALLIAAGIKTLVAEIEMIPHSHTTTVIKALLWNVFSYAFVLGLIVNFGAWVWKKVHKLDRNRVLMPVAVLTIVQFALLIVILGLELITFKGQPTVVTPFCLGFMLSLFFSLLFSAVWDLTVKSSADGLVEGRPLWKAALFSFFALTGALVAADVIGARSTHSLVWPLAALVAGTVGGAFAGFGFGTSEDVSESIVRPLFSWARLLPWQLDHFLEYAADKSLLYHEDRDYRFLHPLFVEYFTLKDSFGEPSKLKGREGK
jgi:DNA polymerase III delta prime subunit/MFS family permease